MRLSSLIVVIVTLFGCTPAPEVVQPFLIPIPQNTIWREGAYILNQEVPLSFDTLFHREAEHLQSMLNESMGITLTNGSLPRDMISLTYNESLPEEGYRMEINEKGITISASDPAGMFYGIQTFRQFLPHSPVHEVALPFASIDDAPAFRHRGMLLDCCRHFMEPEFVKRYIDLLARFKMNVLHWHLTEDQGWRLAIDAYPELTNVGAWRMGENGERYGGFYTKDEVRDIVRYAESRHVQVIPEIEMPGHSSAAIAAYPWLGCTGEAIQVETEWGVFKDIYCAGNDSTIVFLETVLDEVMDLFPSKIIHLGGDEAPKAHWESCKKCQKRIADEGLKDEHELQSYFIQHFANYLKNQGRTAIGWDEILEGGLPEGAMVQSWRGMEGGIVAAKARREVVMSPTSHAYFDYDVKSTDLAEVYHFQPVPDTLDNEVAKYIIGGECNMWTEHAPQEKVDSKMFPRLLAMAEVLWTNHQVRNYDAFLERVQGMYSYLDFLDVSYGPESVPFSVETSVKENGLEVIFNVAYTNGFLKLENGDVLSSDTLLVTDIFDHWLFAYRNNKEYGDSVKISFNYHKGVGKNMKVINGYSPYYTGGGDHALNDGVLGSQDFRDGHWQALTKDDLIVEIDLLEEQFIESISTHFYTYANAWIFMPLEVRFESSLDGVEWQELGLYENELSEDDKRQSIVPVSLSLKGTNARFIRMTAKNRGVCPPWHDAPGEPAWLFCDELIIR